MFKKYRSLLKHNVGTIFEYQFSIKPDNWQNNGGIIVFPFKILDHLNDGEILTAKHQAAWNLDDEFNNQRLLMTNQDDFVQILVYDIANQNPMSNNYYFIGCNTDTFFSLMKELEKRCYFPNR